MAGEVAALAMLWISRREPTPAELGGANVHRGEPGDRLPPVPLMVTLHDWQVPDTTVPTESRRYFIHHLFSGLSGRYQKLMEDARVVFFALGFRGEGPDDVSCLDGVQLREHPQGRPVWVIRMILE